MKHPILHCMFIATLAIPACKSSGPHDRSDLKNETGGTAASASPRGARPNVVLIVADDLGYSDLGSYGGEIHTPNIDALARNGVRFTNFYNSSRCSPSRASLLTGHYPHRVNMGRNGRSMGMNGLTIAEALKNAGYKTAMTGKWHLSADKQLPGDQHLAWLNHQLPGGNAEAFAPDLKTYPVGRGFQQHYGTIWGVVDYFDPFSLVDGTTPIDSVPSDFYMTNAIRDKTVEYIENFAQEPDPFFLYVAFTAPHWPLHALPEDIAKYKDMYTDGWVATRNARYRKQLEMGLFNKDNAPLPVTEGGDWARLTEKQREFLRNAMRTHAAMVDRVDQSVGTIVESLRQAGKLDNTLILFLSDNGASPEIYLQPGYDRPSQTRAGEAVVYCGGIAPCPYSNPGDQKTWSYLGPSWANAANTPFRQAKITSFRGGNSTPFIAHWPAGLRTSPGSINTQRAHVIDVLPTVLEATGAPYPNSYEGRAITAIDGKSLIPILDGKQRPINDLYFEHEGGAALIRGEYKLVRLNGSSPWELYHLATDRTETKNLAAADPARLNTMVDIWSRWYNSVPH